MIVTRTSPGAATTRPSSRRGGVPRRRTLIVIRGDLVEARPLPWTGEVTIGRGDRADVQIDEPSISRVHLTVVLAADAIRIVDRGSQNGTSLRSVRLPVDVPVEIAPNEPFAAGDVVLAIQEVGAPAAIGAPAPRRPTAAFAPGVARPIVLDPAMGRLYELAARIARGAISVLLCGETGTGKEVLCEHIHGSSARHRGPLVRINCAALTEQLVEAELFGHDKGAFTGAHAERPGLIEAGDGGTVFLDEVGELSLALQAKLLRVLEQGTVTRLGSTTPRAVDVRFVAATNRDLEADVEAGRFRRDLYFRLAGVVLAIPPLAERPDEIEALARSFAAAAAARLGRAAPSLDAGALDALRAHAWPGNVRELRNVIERAVLICDGAVLDTSALGLGRAASAAPSEPAPSGRDLPGELAGLEKQRILDALAACAGNQTRAAAEIGMPLRTFVKRLAAYGIARPRAPRNRRR
jgi:DNA-binding NtrC family response regulator